MGNFTAGDIVFIIFILGVIHGIMLLIGVMRRRKTTRNVPLSPD